MMKSFVQKSVLLSTALVALAGCNKGTGSYSLLTDANDYKQQAVLVPKKIDILWVIDNSGSMATSQSNIIANYQSFIRKFQQQNYDFHMAVTTTDAWEKKFYPTSVKARLRDGVDSNHSGVFVMNRNTPDLASVFETNIRQGIKGLGDERALESLRQTLEEPFTLEKGFRRDEAFLAVIILSDEEDFSHSSNSMNESYANPNLTPVQEYIDYLDGYTKRAIFGKNYSVNSIVVSDEACRKTTSTPTFSTKIAKRVIEITEKTDGVVGSICSNFGETLELISDTIIQLSATFKLHREPRPDTIFVSVNGQPVPQDINNGWTYDAQNWTITFHGSAVPAANANIQIDFYPKTIKL